MFNAQQEVAGVPFTTAITVAAVRRAELDDAPATEPAPARALSEQGIADAAYEARLKSLTPKGLDFVNKNRLWPPYRTSMNPMAQHDGKTEETHKKGDWSAQRSRFIREIFNEMFTLHPERHTGTDGADALFDGGCYGWLQQTSQVINAVMLKYGAGSQVGKALTALMGLCEIKRYLDAKQEFHIYCQAVKRKSPANRTPDSDPVTTPDSPVVSVEPADAAKGALAALAIEVAARSSEDDWDTWSEFQARKRDIESRRSDLEIDFDLWAYDQYALGVSDHVIEAVKDKCVAELDVSQAPSGRRGTVRGRVAPSLLQKPYAGRVPSAQERREWEDTATVYYTHLLCQYQTGIGKLRQSVDAFVLQDGLDVSA